MRLPRIPGVFFEPVFLSAALIIVVLALIQGNWLWRWDQVLYDAYFKLWSQPAPDDVVIVGIDADSLAVYGAWPWPRQRHARLIQNLTEAGAKVIVFDVIFAEPVAANPDGDRLLAAASERSGRIILPVLVEHSDNPGHLLETLPFPLLAETAAGLGHVHVELDADGIARSVYLKEGMGTAYWPSLGLAALLFLDKRFGYRLPGKKQPAGVHHAMFRWVRNHRVRIPYIGPPGAFASISYHQVLDKMFARDAFKNKIVFVGATAEGLGDSLPTPVSGFNRPMSGVEIHANILTALRANSFIQDMPKFWHIGISLFFVSLPGILFPWFSPKTNFMLSGVLVILAVLLSSALLLLARLWLPPMPLVMALSLSYPVWSWRRQEAVMNYLDHELERLQAEPNLPGNVQPLSKQAVIERIMALFPVDGWVLIARNDQIIRYQGACFYEKIAAVPEHLPCYQQDILWLDFVEQDARFILGLHWIDQNAPEARHIQTLETLLRWRRKTTRPSSHGRIELIQMRIQQVQAATNNLRNMRHLLADSLGDMADGVLIANIHGQILLANSQAALFLKNDPKRSLNCFALHEIMQMLERTQTCVWQRCWLAAVAGEHVTGFHAHSPAGFDLFVQMYGLSVGQGHDKGVIVNLTDITPLKESERRRSELLGFLSHDLRSPLNSILALLEMERHPGQGFEDKNTRVFSRIERYTRNVLELSENFLQLARAEEIEAAAFYEVDLVAIAYNAMEHVWTLAQEKAIEIKHESDLDIAWLWGDGNLLERLLINLLGNAIKYSPEHSVIELHIGEDKKNFFCSIRDYGSGIDEAFIPHLFERFSRSRTAVHGKISGAGLGLAFADVVAKKHQGHIEVESQLGKGACFCLYLPKPHHDT